MKIESMIKDKIKDLQMQRNSSNDCLEKTTKGILDKKYGDRAAFLVLFNPDNQYRYTREIDRCFFGSGPTLFEVGIMYGDNTPILWLVAQLINLSEYCGLKEKATTLQLEERKNDLQRVLFPQNNRANVFLCQIQERNIRTFLQLF